MTTSKLLISVCSTLLRQTQRLWQKQLGEDPDGLRRLLRNEFEIRLNSVRGEVGGSVFFNKLLSTDRDFRMFLIATKSMPSTRQALIDMRRAFKDLSNPTTVRTADALARRNTDDIRNATEFVTKVVLDASQGLCDRAAVEIITNPKWHEELAEILKLPRLVDRSLGFSRILVRAHATSRE